jgi:hypothetical protein
VRKPTAPTNARPSTSNAPWANLVPSTGSASSTDAPRPSRAVPRAASEPRDRAHEPPAPPARPVRPAADAMVRYISKPKAPPCPTAIAAGLQAAVNVNQRHGSQAMDVDRDDRVLVKEPPILLSRCPLPFTSHGLLLSRSHLCQNH